MTARTHRWTHRGIFRAFARMMCAGAALTTLACGTDGPTLPLVNTDPETVFTGVRLNVHALMLDSSGTHATYQLIATPLDGNGDPLQTTAKPEFLSRNAARIMVSEDGAVTGRAPGDAGFVIARITVGQLTFSDSVSVRVAFGNASLTSLDLRPIPDTNPRIAVAFSARVNAVSTGVNTAGIEFFYSTSDPRSFVFPNKNPYTTRIRMDRPGRAVIYATTTVGGTTWTDSLVYTVVNQATVTVNVTRRQLLSGEILTEFNPSPVYIATGGTVIWNGASPVNGLPAFGIQFDKPDRANPLPGSSANDNVQGNIAPFFNASGSFFDPAATRSRRFFQPDTIAFTSPELHLNGKVIVVGDGDCTPFCGKGN